MKSFKLEFDERVEERLSEVEMKNIAGGGPVVVDTDTELFGSRFFCFTNVPGDCSKSKSCKNVLICIPIGR